MVDRDFGLSLAGHTTYLDEVISGTEEIPSDQAQILLSMAYDVTYGIHDHLNETTSNPLSTVAMHNREQYWENSGLYRAIERYERQDINNRFGLSLTEYLSLPREVVNMLTEITISIARKMEALENDAQDNAKRQADQKSTWNRFQK